MSSPTFRRRLILRYAATLLLVLVVLGFVLDRTLRVLLLDRLTDSLTSQARAVTVALPAADADLQEAVVGLGEDLGLRITVIAPDGVVLADSTSDPAGLENHGSRPEVVAALGGTVGVSSRTSASLSLGYRYVALPVEADRIVRVALPLKDVEEQLYSLRLMLIGVGGAAALVGLFGVWLIGRRAMRPLERLTEAVRGVSTGSSERISASGVAELDELADTVWAMSAEIDRQIGELNRERELRDLVLSAIDVGVALIGEAGTVYANESAKGLISETADSRLFPRELDALVSEAAAGQTSATGEYVAGHPRRTIAAAASWLSHSGLVLLTLTDMTEARRVEAVRRDFVAAASHELKTPAAAIQAGSETVLRALANDPEAAREFAERVHDQAVRLARIVSDLLDLSRLETQAPQRDEVALADLIAGEVERLGKLDVQVNVDAEPIAMWGSGADLALAVRNLLHNAVRHTPSGGHVWVNLSRRNGDATIEVADDGVGIPAADLPRVFERFYRVDAARSQDTGGTGLGLAIVKHVAEEHGGGVEAESTLGQGSVFRMILPIS